MRTILAAALAALAAAPALAQGCAEGERLFDHALLQGGPQCIPAEPERIAFLHTEAIPAFLLGAETVTINGYFETFIDAYPGAVGDEWVERAVDIGYAYESDPELIARADPDLIVSTSYDDAVNAKFAAIAPMVVLDYADGGLDWRETNEFVAALLGREEALARQFAALDARVADIRDRLAERDPSVAMVRALDEGGRLQVATQSMGSLQLLEDAGLRRHEALLSVEEAARLGNAFWYELSLERIEDLAADFLVVLPGWDPEVEREVRASPFWGMIEPVAEGRVVTPLGDGQRWVRDNVAYAHLILDDVYRDVLGLDPAEVSPNPFADWLGGAD